MSGRGRRVDERIAHTVTFLLRCPGSTVPEAMRACKFSLEESLHPAKKMAVRRSFAKASACKAVAPPRCYCCRGDSYDDNSVAADQSNLCGQRSIDAADAAADDDDDDDDDGRSDDDDPRRGDRRATGAVKRREGDRRRDDDDDDYGRTRQRRR